MNATYIILIAVAAVLLIVLIMWIISKLKGKVEIQLEKLSFSSGEDITGKVILKLKKPVESKALYVQIIGENKTTPYNRTSPGMSRSSNTNRIYEFRQNISGQKLYPAGESYYDFKLKAPSISSSRNISINFKNPLQTLQGNNSVVNWYIIAGLDIPGIDISKRMNIQVA